MREKQTSCKMMASESDIIDVDEFSSHSSDSAASIGGIHNDSTNQAPLESCILPPLINPLG